MAKRGRPSNQELARRAAQQANVAAKALQVNNPDATEQRVDQSNDHIPSANERLEPSYDDDSPPPQPRNEPRRLAMEEVEARDLLTMGVTQEQNADTEQNPKQDQEKEIKSEPEKPEEQPIVAAPSTEGAPPATEIKMVKVKVDGEEFEVPQTDVDAAGGITAYQKDRAAENRLRRANEALAETRRTQAAIAEWIKQQSPKAPTQSDDEFIQSRIQLINFGTPEEQVTASRELREKLTPQINQNAIVQQAIVAMQQQAAETQFVNEFQDLVKNPILLKLIIQEKNDRLSKLREAPDWPTFYRSIGNEVRNAIGRQSQPATHSEKSPDSTSPVDREARKASTASIVSLPTAAVRAELPKEEKPETHEDILREMRKSRGLPTG